MPNGNPNQPISNQPLPQPLQQFQPLPLQPIPNQPNTNQASPSPWAPRQHSGPAPSTPPQPNNSKYESKHDTDTDISIDIDDKASNQPSDGELRMYSSLLDLASEIDLLAQRMKS